MKLDVGDLPLGEVLIGFVLAAVAVTFVLAFVVGTKDGGIEEQPDGDEAVAETSPTPAATPAPTDGTAAAATPSPELVARGRELAAVNACLGCHSTTGDVIVGPSWKGLFGKEEKLADGSTVTVDEAYILESVRDPPLRIVEGFSALMYTFPTLTDEDIRAIAAYIQSLE